MEHVEVIFRDFLKTDLKEFELALSGYTVVANLPYYVTTPLIMKIIEQSEKCKGLSVMVQEEVAERLCSRIAMVKGGRLVVAGDTDKVKGDHSLESVFMEVQEHE